MSNFNKFKIKELFVKLNSKSGRNNSGQITVRHKSAGEKKRYCLVDFKRNLKNIPALVFNITYDPYRSSFLALILYKNGYFSYILAASNLKYGDLILNSNKADIVSGNNIALKYLPIGTLIHNIELFYGRGGQICRAAGTFGVILSKKINYVLVKLRSGEEYFIYDFCTATVGIVSNELHRFFSLKKAGVSRRLGIRPTVRGVAMNPIDHPHGGGEGKTSGGRPSVSFTGKLTKGKNTRNKQKKNKFIFKSRKF